ncbi:MAG: enoyl-CoA hydratase/isomerase family protein [bacterium]|nr:enoyl-CoA hydratase/isomerase family protein [bacterium]
MSTYDTILYDKQRSGVRIALNRPEMLNAISRQMEDELSEALSAAERDPEVRAIVLTGMGRAFSSGYDIGGERPDTVWPAGLPEGQSVAEALDNWRDRSRVSGRKLLQVWELSKPVIAAVNGWCIGGGSWYALACHMTYASEDAVFAQPEVRMISNTSFFWTLKAGYKHALRYGLTGDHIDAQEALRIGILNDIVPKDELIDYCFDIVERIAKVSPETVKINLQVATKGLQMMGLGNALALNEELSAQVHTSQREDFKRHLQEAQKQGGMRAFLKERDDPFRPEPFGPKSQSRNG